MAPTPSRVITIKFSSPRAKAIFEKISISQSQTAYASNIVNSLSGKETIAAVSKTRKRKSAHGLDELSGFGIPHNKKHKTDENVFDSADLDLNDEGSFSEAVDDDFIPVEKSSVRGKGKGKDQAQTRPGRHSKSGKTTSSTKLSKAKDKKAPRKYHINMQEGKPEPFGQPEVWADKRQQLCETLPYYNTYQASAYTHDRIVYGFLCDKEVGPRDSFDDQVIICKIGGDKVKDENGDMVLVRDQDIDKTLPLSFLRSKEIGQAVAVILGQGNKLSPSRLPHYYNVLDWFHITDVWYEKQEKKCWMVRAEKINLNERSWWSAKDSDFVPPSLPYPKTEKQTCIHCQKPSKTIYTEGWVCLNGQCPNHFDFGREVDTKALKYNEMFLEERTEYPGKPPGPLSPPLLTDDDLKAMDVPGFEILCKKGIVCRKCGCCSRRINWGYWSCENKDCDFRYEIYCRPVTVAQAIAQGMSEQHQTKRKDFVSSQIRTSQFIVGRYNVFEYLIPGGNSEDVGFIRLFKADEIANQQPGGPNDIFMQMQEAKMDLKRHPSRQKDSPGEILTSHFAANWGAFYKYVVTQVSKPFDESPEPILRAYYMLSSAAKQAPTAKFGPIPEFNELLSLGYPEKSHIGYHDDGEKELGPTIATLSLGCSASMGFRPKKKSKNGKSSDILRITLDHGDILIMHGAEIQHYYEHAVDPNGKLRFALTCRHVKPEMKSTEKEMLDAIQAGTLPPDSEKYRYDVAKNAERIEGYGDANILDIYFNELTAMTQTGMIDRDELQEKFKERFGQRGLN